METLQKAEIIYSDGWMIRIPKHNNAPMLFMEWLAVYNASQCPIHKVINGEVLCVRMNGTKQAAYQSAMDYINDNI